MMIGVSAGVRSRLLIRLICSRMILSGPVTERTRSTASAKAMAVAINGASIAGPIYWTKSRRVKKPFHTMQTSVCSPAYSASGPNPGDLRSRYSEAPDGRLACRANIMFSGLTFVQTIEAMVAL